MTVDPAYPTTPPHHRSRLDHRADKAPAAVRHKAGAAALAADKMATAMQRARARPFPIALTTLAVGAGIGLMAYGPSRRAIGSAISGASRSTLGAFGRQLGRELRSFVR